MENYYQILQVAEDADKKQISSAFKRLALRYHPDRNPDDHKAEEQFKLINQAYQVLSNPESRRRYDQQMRYGFDVDELSAATAGHSARQRRRRRPHYGPVASMVEPYRVKGLYIYIFGGFVLFAGLALYFFNLMEHAAARNFLQMAQTAWYVQGDAAISLERLNMALQKNNNLPEAHYLKALVLQEQPGQTDAAILHMDQAIAFAEGDSARYFYERGKLLRMAENPVAALKDFEKLILMEPNHPQANFHLAELYLYHLKNYERAIDFFNHDLALAPGRVASVTGKGVALQQLQDYERAEKYLQLALKKKPLNGEALYWLGFNRLKYQKDTAAACNYWQQAAELDVRETRNLLNKYCQGASANTR